MKFCCNEFDKQAGALQSPIGLGLIYPDSMRPNAQFETDNEGAWNINGCCGGGCYVVEVMRFCPYCGATLIDAAANKSANGT